MRFLQGSARFLLAQEEGGVELYRTAAEELRYLADYYSDSEIYFKNREEIERMIGICDSLSN